MMLTYIFIALVAAAIFDGKLMVEAATSEAARTAIKNHHNTIRNNVTLDIGKTASNMMKMEYDTSLETSAAAWSSQCIKGHSVEEDVGENIYYKWNINTQRDPTTSDFEAASLSWWKEKFDYTFGGDNGGAVVGHYTQQIWWNSDKLGCAGNWCDTLTNPKTGAQLSDAIIIVCQYKAPGNWINNDPFTEGSNNCNSNDATYENLCSPCTTEQQCYNKGTWNVATCECDCKPIDDNPNDVKYLADCKYDCTGVTTAGESSGCPTWSACAQTQATTLS